jgi:antitoxin HicB
VKRYLFLRTFDKHFDKCKCPSVLTVGNKSPTRRPFLCLPRGVPDGYPEGIGDPAMQYKIPLTLAPQPEGGYTVTSPLLPELLTEGDTAEEALSNVKDALAAVVEIYHDLGRSLPSHTQVLDLSVPLSFETVVTTP